MRQMIVVLLLGLYAGAAHTANFQTYINSAGNKQLNMNERWSSLVKAAEVATAGQLGQIKEFSDHSEWFMRNAALVALKKINQQEARQEARKLIKDKALVVRSAAVDILAEDLVASDDRRLLMEELNQDYNFNKKSSLWIRQQILEKLSDTATASDRQFFAKTLFDADKNLAELSARTLAKIDGQGSETKSLQQWQKLVKERNWL
ncbi:hypothetical protein [Pseudobdellovibrio exovorus]|uniref:HEAT repeat domain-containing protein n=1 Tax=Pseudobdellovibrio exovorus JSS TaxID=1184267 RepID=M4VDA9_9BACT|nr:hypothetical protein [Pseudobdellovibrio exovorus]AGH96001.1 hypothetical protein A11Q_1785 [Pseudobdellovibrio exovorus JSS]